MSFDGIPRPSQLNPYADPLGAYIGSNAAAEKARKQAQIKSVEEMNKGVQARRRDEEDEDDEDNRNRKRRNSLEWDLLSEEERELLEKFAKVRGLMNFSLESGTRYVLEINTQTGMVDFAEQKTGHVVLSLTPDEFHELSLKMERYFGVLTDRSA